MQTPLPICYNCWMSTSRRPQTVKGLRIDHSTTDLDTSRLTWRPGAYAFIFDAQGHLLVLDNGWNGKHDLPGGGIEIWERVEAALAREIWEETGLEIEVGALVDADDEFFMTPHNNQWHTIKLYYLARVLGGDIRGTILDGEQSINPHWVDPKTLTPGDLTLGWQALQKAIHQTDRDTC